MQPQDYERLNQDIHTRLAALQREDPGRLERGLNLSWSNWGFGLEPLAVSAARLARFGVRFIELHGNHYGPDLGYRAPETLRVLEDHGIRVAGICGMFSAENDLSSNSPVSRQRAIDYLKRTVAFCAETGGGYVLVVPGAVGRPVAYDDTEFDRSVDSLQRVADVFTTHDVKAAIEPIRGDEVSFCHTIADAVAYIDAVDHPGVRHINGDVFHMQAGERHIGMAVLEAGERLVNLHVADSNREALGDGMLDVDTLIAALYLAGFNREGCFVTPEPLGSGADPYPAMHGKPDPARLDRLVERTVTTFREREAIVRARAGAAA